MATKVAINGFGRIGRNVARAILERPDCGLELVAINDLASAKANALLFKRDSVHGAYPGTVEVDGNDLVIARFRRSSPTARGSSNSTGRRKRWSSRSRKARSTTTPCA